MSQGSTFDDDGELVAALDADLRAHSSFGDKVSGGRGEIMAAEWIEERLGKLGFDVRRQHFGIPFFVTRQAVLLAAELSAEIYPQPLVVSTGTAGITAPIAVVRAAYEAADARARIALLCLPYGRYASITAPPVAGLVKAVAAAGAKAIVIVPTGPSAEAVALNAPGDAPFVPVPIAILAPQLAEPFLIAARAGASATLIIDGEREERPTRNILASLQRGPQWLALSTPRTGWFECASERGTGIAAFLALTAWAADRFPDLSIFAMNMAGHEYNFIGTPRALEAAPPPENTLLWAHIGSALATRDALDWRGQSILLPSADPMRLLMASEPLRPALAEMFRGLSGLEHPLPVLPGVGELSGILGRGYRRGFGVLGVPRWYHTRSDTLDKLDSGLLLPVVRAYQRSIERIVLDG
jgi:hypothetical protein